ncbi:MAG TPA: protein translocase subunit SecD [Deltaproteobacteria bacterium]|jgi:preprotein translocase subunit SecD|nr:protein translocase subunit SecD [Deltaproteobacteria bacterium]HOI08652.1 protein translocase subunit SecD [Deltaproteobacteria bacterium]
MDKFKLKGLLILAVLIVGIVLAAPSFFGKGELPEGYPGWKQKIKLGLDLQGGMHLVLQVVTEKAVESRMASVLSELRGQMINERIHYSKAVVDTPMTLKISLRVPDEYEKLERLVLDTHQYLKETNREKGTDGSLVLTYRISDKEAKNIRDQAVEQALETIRNRVDQYGVSEPSIIPQGADRIVLQLPGVTDPERAKKIIGKTALLEFKLVDEEASVTDAASGNVPAGSYIAYMKDGNQPVILKQQAPLTGAFLEDARVKIDQYNEPYLSIAFNREGGRIFERVTSENVGKRLAILLDGKVYSTPVIRDAISGGKAVIEGRFTMEEAKDLAVVLRAGSLPAPVTVLEERTVGPTLGQDSIRKGIIASLVGSLLVVFFMLIYYKLSGLIADLALTFNMILMIGTMSALGWVLTLPGIAGFVLTIGMAIDANVLVFERIREELRLGRTPKMAVEMGYKNAFSAIFDSNITTIIAAVVLIQFGTGPVRGFAVTLCIGLVWSMFTALVLCRWIQEWVVTYKNTDHVSI